MRVWRTSTSHCRWNANNTICNEMKVVWSGGGCAEAVRLSPSCHLLTYRPSSIVRARVHSACVRTLPPYLRPIKWRELFYGFPRTTIWRLFQMLTLKFWRESREIGGKITRGEFAQATNNEQRTQRMVKQKEYIQYCISGDSYSRPYHSEEVQR